MNSSHFVLGLVDPEPVAQAGQHSLDSAIKVSLELLWITIVPYKIKHEWLLVINSRG